MKDDLDLFVDRLPSYSRDVNDFIDNNYIGNDKFRLFIIASAHLVLTTFFDFRKLS